MPVALAAAALVTACPPREDVTPRIRVSPGADARLRLAGRGAAREGARAFVRPLAAGEHLAGPNALGSEGDLLLGNDEVLFVVERLGRGSGFAQGGGNVVDAADARARVDELGQIVTYFGSFPRQAVYDALEVAEEKDGAATITARGRDSLEPSLHVTTRYRLAPTDRALLVSTTIEHRGKGTVTLPSLGDAVQWGSTEKVAPGLPRGFRGRSRGAFVGGIGERASYALTGTTGDVEAVSGSSWTDTEQRREVALGPGARVTYERVLVVGERGDLASVVSELALAAGQAVGEVTFALAAPDGAPLAIRDGDRVRLGESLDVVARGGRLEGRVPPGRYEARIASPSRSAAGASVVDVPAGGRASVTLAAREGVVVDVGCEEAARPVPCTVLVEGDEGTPTPNLGFAHAAGAAGSRVTLGAARAPVRLPRGAYTLLATRGPEYTLAEVHLRVDDAAPPSHRVTLPLARVVDTRGYVAADLHQHSALSGDAPVSAADRVVTNAAVGVEVAVATEHNTIADLRREAKALGLDGHVVSLAGVELTSDGLRRPFGHLNALPLQVDAAAPRGGAPPLSGDVTAPELAAAMKGRTPSPLVQVNHPRSGRTGYFDLARGAADAADGGAADGAGTAPPWEPGFDLLEVWNGRNVDARERVLVDYLALVVAGKGVTPTASTDTHGVVGQEPGYPRTYVRLDDAAPLDRWDETRTQAFAASLGQGRDVVLTNGPFVRATIEGAGPGEVARRVGSRPVAVEVEVRAAPWIDVRRVVARSARQRGAVLAARELPARPLDRLGNRPRVERVTFPVPLTGDDAVVVEVRGDASLAPVLRGDPDALRPYAVTSAIVVDVDGDGVAFGHRVASPRAAVPR